MIGRSWNHDSIEPAQSAANLWILQHGPCWCRGLPGDSGSFDLIRFRSNRLDLGHIGLNYLVVSERVLDGSGPTTRQVFDTIPNPKVVISTGTCPAAARFWDEPLVSWTPVSELLPIDLAIDDCIFGRPEALLEPVLSLGSATVVSDSTHLSKAAAN